MTAHGKKTTVLHLEISATVRAVPSGDPHSAEPLLREISKLARGFGKTAVRRDEIDDVAQDVVLICWRKIRDRTWDIDDATLPGYVRSLVRRRAHDRKRSTERSDLRELDHAYEIDGRQQCWMSPSDMLDVDLLMKVEAEILSGIPPVRLRAFIMVRVEKATYAEVGEQLGISPYTVGSHVQRVQRAIRIRLRERGIHAPTRFESIATKKERRERTEEMIRRALARSLQNPALQDGRGDA